jgi:hypothetical protein
MNLEQVAQALGLAQAYDNRTVGEVNVRAWHAILGDLGAADVMEAIRRHYAEKDEWIMPAHIRRAVERIELEQARAARKWAPGQAGVAPEDALPEIEGPELSDAAIAGMPPEMRAFLNKLAEEKGLSPSEARETLMPRRVAWEREHAAFIRSQKADPNPHYRPTTADPRYVNVQPGERECVVDGGGHCQTHDRHVSACPPNGRG